MRRWILRNTEPVSDPAPAGTDGLPRLILRLLRGRGIPDSGIRRWLDPRLEDLHDPFLLPDLALAVERITRAIAGEERIFVFGDYDVDGTTSAVVLTRYLRTIGATVRVRIPDRLSEGYGLSSIAIDEAREWGAALILTTDCGTTAIEEIAYARACGIDVIILDHHLPRALLPAALAIVNPYREDSPYPFRDLAGVGVVSKLIQGLDATGGPPRKGDAPESYFDLTALGTIADAMSLHGENRILARQGLRIMRSRPKPAFIAVAQAAGLDLRSIRSQDLAFQIIPRLNAAGRLGESKLTLDLLLSDDPVQCRQLASRLEMLNIRRRELMGVAVQEAIGSPEAARAAARNEPIILVSRTWHPGIVGIAASRVVEHFGVPAILLAGGGDVVRGSGRAPGDEDLLGLLEASSGALLAFGGHRSAVGLTLEFDQLSRFRDQLLLAARDRPAGRRIGEEEALEIDLLADLVEIDLKFLHWLDRFEPFGSGNGEPIFAVRGRVVGGIRVLKEKHLRFDLVQNGVVRECIGFGFAHRRAEIEGAGEIHLAAVASKNAYQGEERVQLQLRDMAVADPF
jgi:single-stranded-DNA-specific exonuclease